MQTKSDIALSREKLEALLSESEAAKKLRRGNQRFRKIKNMTF